MKRLDDIVIILLMAWLVYACLGALVLSGQLRRASGHHPRAFGPPEYEASIIVGLRGAHPRLKRVLEGLCQQRYPRPYEVIMACESKSDPVWAVAVEVARDNPQVQLVESDPVDPKLRTGKNQNLLAAVEVAQYEALVFTDADVVHSKDWLARLVAPLGNTLEGQEVAAATSLFYLAPSTFWGRLAAIAVNQVNFSAANLRRWGPWAPFASGASTAVLRSAFRSAGVARAWQEAFNDDLVMANLLVDQGHPIYLLREVTWPEEDLASWRAFAAKFRRWIVTLHYYSHPRLARQAYVQAAAQQQLPVALVLALWLTLAEGSWYEGGVLMACGIIYSIFSRASIALSIGERLGPWLLLAPPAFLFFIGYYLLLLLPREFTWSGRRHRVTESYSKLRSRLRKADSSTSFSER